MDDGMTMRGLIVGVSRVVVVVGEGGFAEGEVSILVGSGLMLPLDGSVDLGKGRDLILSPRSRA